MMYGKKGANYMTRRIIGSSILGVGILIIIALGMGIFYICSIFSGGVVWSNKSAQADMVRLIQHQYPQKSFRVTTKAYWEPKTDSYGIGVVFNSDKSTEFFFGLLPYNGYKMLIFKSRPDESVDVLTETPAPGVNASQWYKDNPNPSFNP
jgi:hypothetical protein